MSEILGHRTCDAEIGQDHPVDRKLLQYKDVGWLDVTVHDSGRVYVIQRAGDLSERGEWVPPRRQPHRGPSRRKLHREPARSALVHGDDVGMTGPTGKLELPEQPAQVGLVVMPLVKDLQRDDVSWRVGVVRPVDGR